MIEGIAFDLANDMPLDAALMDIIAVDDIARRYGVPPSQARFLSPYDYAAMNAASEYYRYAQAFQ